MDAHLPRGECVSVVIANNETLQIMQSMAAPAPDFILRTDLRSGWVMPGAINKGLWPKA
jgi:hypothetical protein